MEDEEMYEMRSMNNKYELNNGMSLEIADEGDGRVRILLGGHIFNFYNNHEVVTMDRDYIPSLLKKPDKLRLGKSHGYGVFASENIYKGEVVEEAPMLSQDKPYLTDYTFGINGEHCLALGFGSMYNHSDNPNISHKVDISGKIIIFIANRNISEGEQCTINYGSKYFPSRGKIADVL